MEHDSSPVTRAELAALAKECIRDAETLVSQHGRLLRTEVREQIEELAHGALALGAGTGLLATGGFLSTLMLVHALNRATRWPLWACYGAVGSLLAITGASLMGAGAQRAARVQLWPPPQTAAALKEDLEWLKNQVS